MVYFYHKNEPEFVYRLDRKIDTVFWNYGGRDRSTIYPYYKIQKYFSDGTWIKCTKKGIPLEINND